MFKKFFLAIIVAGVSAPGVRVAYTQAVPDPVAISKDIRAGDIEQRRAAADRLRDAMDVLTDPRVVSAIKEDFARFSGDERRWLRDVRLARRTGAVPPPPPSPPLRSPDYERELEALMIDSKNPAFIPELSWAVGNSGPAIDALARFGEVAFPTLVNRYRDVCLAQLDCPESLRYGVLLAIARMFEGNSIGQSTRTAALNIAREALRSDDPELITGAINIVGASCDDGLRQELASVTAGPRRLNGVRESQAQGIVSRGQRALQECLQKSR